MLRKKVVNIGQCKHIKVNKSKESCVRKKKNNPTQTNNRERPSEHHGCTTNNVNKNWKKQPI